LNPVLVAYYDLKLRNVRATLEVLFKLVFWLDRHMEERENGSIPLYDLG
jgi:hypothetical protein